MLDIICLRYASNIHKFKFKFKNQTTLSQHIWSLKDRSINFKVSWKIIGRAKSFSPVTGVCRLCTLEKFYLMTKPEEGTLNKNEEIYRACLHKSHQLLVPKPKGKTWIIFLVLKNQSCVYFYINMLMLLSHTWWVEVKLYETICSE